MFHFDMKVSQNFASFTDAETGRVVYVDSFDNREFNVRFGTAENTAFLGSFVADTDAALNASLQKLVATQP